MSPKKANSKPNPLEEKITEAEIALLADKLDKWGRKLPANEKILLDMIIARAASADLKAGDEYSMTDTKRIVTDALTPYRMVGSRKSWMRDGPLWARWSSRQY